MEGAFFSLGLWDMNKVMLSLDTGTTWGVLTTSEAQIPLPRFCYNWYGVQPEC